MDLKQHKWVTWKRGHCLQIHCLHPGSASMARMDKATFLKWLRDPDIKQALQNNNKSGIDLIQTQDKWKVPTPGSKGKLEWNQNQWKRINHRPAKNWKWWPKINSARRLGFWKFDQDHPRTILCEFSNIWTKRAIYNEMMVLQDAMPVKINEDLSREKKNTSYLKLESWRETNISILFIPGTVSFLKKDSLYQWPVLLHTLKIWKRIKTPSPASPKVSRTGSSNTLMNTAHNESSFPSQESEEALFGAPININDSIWKYYCLHAVHLPSKKQQCNRKQWKWTTF